MFDILGPLLHDQCSCSTRLQHINFMRMYSPLLARFARPSVCLDPASSLTCSIKSFVFMRENLASANRELSSEETGSRFTGKLFRT